MAIRITEDDTVIYENEPNVNRQLFPNLPGGYASQEQITQAVDNWLEDHPEATTTVTDGSITREKLDSELNSYIEDTTNSLDSVNAEIGELKEKISDVIDITITTKASTFIGKNTGFEASSNQYVATDFIPVSNYIMVYTYSAGDDNAGYSFYNENKDPVSGSYASIYPIRSSWAKLTVPTGAKYFRTSCRAAQAANLKIKMPLTDNVLTLLGDDVYSTIDGISYENGYYINNDGVLGAFVSSDNYRSKVVLVQPGEIYYITGTGATTARLWSTHFNDGTTSRVADASASAVQTGIVIEIQANEKYLVLNSTSSAGRYGIVPGNHARSTFNTRDLIRDVKHISDATAASALYTFRNNLSTDGVEKMPLCEIYNNGVASPSNYGLSGSSYHISMPASKKLHLYFEFMQTEAIKSNSSASINIDTKILVDAFGIGKMGLFYHGSAFDFAELVQNYVFRAMSGSNVGNYRPKDYRFQPMQGEDAFAVQYTNTVDSNSSCTIVFQDSGVTVTVDGVEQTIPCSSDTTISDLVDAIDEISGISATLILSEGYTYGDLLPIVSKSGSSSTTLNLISTGTYQNNTSYIDAPPVYVPYAVSKKWQTVEILIDPDVGVITALNGWAAVTAIDSTVSVTNELIINKDNLPFMIRNLEVDYNSAGDAEVVDNITAPGSTAGKQLISSHNPRLLIYEGHGVVADVESNRTIPNVNSMAASTERLRVLFETAISKGYEAVTWNQIIDWKVNRKPLPKRSFTIMFDDWQFENYVDYDRRKPFVDYNVKPGLAVITDTHALTDTVVMNGETYLVKDVIDIVMTAGWYCVPHTDHHTVLTTLKPSEIVDVLKASVLAADKYGIHSNILVYPQGEYKNVYRSEMAHSDFCLGVDIVKNSYNCLGISDYYLTRVELSERVALSTVLAPLV